MFGNGSRPAAMTVAFLIQIFIVILIRRLKIFVSMTGWLFARKEPISPCVDARADGRKCDYGTKSPVFFVETNQFWIGMQFAFGFLAIFDFPTIRLTRISHSVSDGVKLTSH